MIDPTNFPKRLLSKRNLKATATRIELIKSIRDHSSAMPFSLIQEKLRSADRITLYRTLQTLLDKGIIHKAFTNTDDTYYALCGDNCTAEIHRHNHVHFRCTKCDTVTCEHLSQEVVIALPGFEIEKTSINITGICKRCQ